MGETSLPEAGGFMDWISDSIMRQVIGVIKRLSLRVHSLSLVHYGRAQLALRASFVELRRSVVIAELGRRRRRNSACSRRR